MKKDLVKVKNISIGVTILLDHLNPVMYVDLSGYDKCGNNSESGKETELFLPDEYYQKLDDNIAKAISARDAEVARIQSLSKTK